MRGSVTDFTLRQNPSAEHILTQANEDAHRPLVAGSMRGSVEFNNLLDEEQDNEVIVEEEEKKEADERQEAEDMPMSPAAESIPRTSVLLTPNTALH